MYDFVKLIELIFNYIIICELIILISHTKSIDKGIHNNK